MSVIATWMQAHDDLADGLRTLRRVWPEGRLDRSQLALDQLAAPLELHMHHEETVLMPAYREVAEGLPPNAAPQVLLSDHAQLRELVASLQASLGASTAPAILEEQDALCRLAGVLEHHDLRERTWFVPALDDHVPPEVAADWVARFAADEAELPAPVVLLSCPALPISLPLDAEEPLVAFRVAVARDRDVAARFAALPCPEHPRGPRLVERCGRLVSAAEAARDLDSRRDALADLAEAARLLAIVASAVQGRL